LISSQQVYSGKKYEQGVSEDLRLLVGHIISTLRDQIRKWRDQVLIYKMLLFFFERR